MKIAKLFYLLLVLILATELKSQTIEADTALTNSELKMNFPSIYFKHNSVEYTTMPYTVDSCFKYIAKNSNDIRDYVIWRDKSETEQLTAKRVLKLKTELNKYTATKNINIETIGNGQKISQNTINKGMGEEQIQFLLSLNSVFDIARTGDPIIMKLSKGNHKIYPKIWCWKCWKHGFHIKYRRKMHKAEKSNKKNKGK